MQNSQESLNQASTNSYPLLYEELVSVQIKDAGTRYPDYSLIRASTQESIRLRDFASHDFSFLDILSAGEKFSLEKCNWPQVRYVTSTPIKVAWLYYGPEKFGAFEKNYLNNDFQFYCGPYQYN